MSSPAWKSRSIALRRGLLVPPDDAGERGVIIIDLMTDNID